MEVQALVVQRRDEPALGSLETGAERGGRRGVNQGHVDPLRAVLWADDLGQTVGPRLAQQLTCNTTRTRQTRLQVLEHTGPRSVV